MVRCRRQPPHHPLVLHVALAVAAAASTVEAAAAASASSSAATVQCDVVSSGPVCLNGGSSIIAPGPLAPSLGGHWKFDGPSPLDSSGHSNHGIGSLDHGPSPVGGGYSALFGKHGKHMMVPDSKAFQSTDFSYSFWIYVLKDPDGQAQEAPRWCPLLRKGIYVTEVEKFANGPALFFSRNTGHLRASMTSSSTRLGDGEFVESNARLARNQWLHLAVVHHGPSAGGARPRLLLYVNGILDARLEMEGMPEANEYPLYVGGDPFTGKDCSFELYMDDLRFYTRAVSPHELQAEAAPAFGGVEPSFVHLGCASCSVAEAMHSCPANRHVCSSIELHTGGYQVAKAVGWLQPGAHVWTHAAVKKAAQGLAMTQVGGGDSVSQRGGRQAPYSTDERHVEAPMTSEALPQPPPAGLTLCCEGAG